MQTQTMNMFAATNEDLPIFSGIDLTELVEWNHDNTNGYCPTTERSIFIRPTFLGEYQVEVCLMDYFAKTCETLALDYVSTIEEAQALAIRVAASE